METYSDQMEGIQALADRRPPDEWLRLAAFWEGCEVKSKMYRKRAAQCRHYAEITQRIVPCAPPPVLEVYAEDLNHNRRPHREAPRKPVMQEGLPLL